MSEGTAGQAGPGQLEALWQTVIEDDLFQSPSHERKYLGFQLFTILLPHLRSAASHLAHPALSGLQLLARPQVYLQTYC